ncbi:ATP-binding protein [Denitratisoma sp. agr-D3]
MAAPVTATAVYSLRRRLLWALTLVTGLVWLAVAASSYVRAHHEADEIFDAQLAEVAQALLVIADTANPAQLNPDQLLAESSSGRRHRHDHGQDEDRQHLHRYQQKILFQIWATRSGQPTLLVRSDNAPAEPVAHDDGFSERNWNGDTWRFYSQQDASPPLAENHHRVFVAQSHDVRDELSRDIALRLMAPLLLGLPLLAAAIWFAVGAAVGPLSAIAAQVRHRQPQRLDPIVADQAMPLEVAPLVTAINDLFQRVDTAMQNERNFTADAAHELRTPLAALKVQAQVARRASDEAQRNQSLAQVEAGVARMTHLVEQLLTLARLDPLSQQQSAQAPKLVDLPTLAAEAAALAMPQALAKRQSLEVNIGEGPDQPQAIQGNPALLQVLLRNLLENAIRYTPEGGAIEVGVAGRRLWVQDSGPGIPAEAHERVLDRFYRHGDAVGVAEGAGLGLAIVARIADLHGAMLSLEDGDGRQGMVGLRICLEFKRV